MEIANRSIFMPSPYCVDDFTDKFDSLYRLVIVSAARAIHIAKSEPRAFASALRGQKPTIKSLEEVLEGKLSYITSGEEEAFADEED